MVVSPLAKQIFVASATWLAAISADAAVSFPTILLHQLQRNDTSIHIDFETSSWIGAIHGLAAIPSILVPLVMQWKGRKFAFMAACVLHIVGWSTVYLARSAAALLVAESIHGLSINSLLATSFMSVSELLPPAFRHANMLLYGVFGLLSISVNGLLNQYLHWKTISIIMCVPIVVALIIGSRWPESPHWLAVKGQFERSKSNFVWIRGTDECSMRELQVLISAQKENMAESRSSKQMSLKGLKAKFSRRDFVLPLCFVFVLKFLVYGSGGIVFIIYNSEIIQKSTKDEDFAQFAALYNAIMCPCFLITIGLGRCFKKKAILLTCITGMVVCMFGAAIVNYLQVVGVLPAKFMLCFFFVMGHSVASGIGIIPITYIYCIELIPVKHRGLGGAAMELCLCLLHTASLKLAPYMFRYVNMWGTFLIYGTNALISGLIIWKFVPETTGRTLQEIEDYYIDRKFVSRNVVADQSDLNLCTSNL